MTAIETTDRCLIVEPATVDREGLRAIIDREPGLELLAQTNTAQEAAGLALEPRVILLGLVSCNASEIKIVDALRARFPNAGILVVAHTADLEALRVLLGVGVGGYVSKSAADTDLLRAVRAVARGEHYLDPQIGAALARKPPRTWSDTPLRDLSGTEVAVLRLVALGYTNAETARLLVCSLRSIESRRAQIQRKLNAHTRAELVRLALDNGLIERARMSPDTDVDASDT